MQKLINFFFAAVSVTILENMDKPKFQFKCDFREKSFFNEEILGFHIKSNHKLNSKREKKCEFCDKTYLSKKSLNAHVKIIHSNSKIYECETCTKVFLNKSTLNTHKKSVHEGIKPLKVYLL